jgi:D-sedoheptulose 7-phosphate isomerase
VAETTSPDVPPIMAAQLAEHLDAARALESVLPTLETVSRRLIAALADGGRLYTFGNGGSAADAQHLAGELIGRYLRNRRPLPAIALSVDPSVVTCIANDYSFEDAFARQVEALAEPGDVVAGFTTSGRSPNVVAGLAAARVRGATTVLFTGRDPGPAGEVADHVLAVPAATTARIQEMHVLLLHLLSERVDAWVAGEDDSVAKAGSGVGGNRPEGGGGERATARGGTEAT